MDADVEQKFDELIPLVVVLPMDESMNDSSFFVILVESLPLELALLTIGEEKVNDLVALVVEETSKLHNLPIDTGRVVYEAFNGSSLLKKLDKFNLLGSKSCVIDINLSLRVGRGVIGAREGLPGVFVRDGVVRM
jgi:hypothetical protein